MLVESEFNLEEINEFNGGTIISLRLKVSIQPLAGEVFLGSASKVDTEDDLAGCVNDNMGMDVGLSDEEQ